jgi:N-acetylglucosamine malate deacetylase 1
MNVLVIAPHPDDETLGCGGTLFRHRKHRDDLFWLIVTEMKKEAGFSEAHRMARKKEIRMIAKRYGFKTVFELGLPAAMLETIPMGITIKKMGNVIQEVKPDILYIPHAADIHTDHRITVDAVSACTKWFRYPSIKRVLAYETLSETHISIRPNADGFRPNVYVDVTEFLEGKIDTMRCYAGEMKAFPFPRSETAIRALAALRGSESGFQAAEAFMLLKEIVE